MLSTPASVICYQTHRNTGRTHWERLQTCGGNKGLSIKASQLLGSSPPLTPVTDRGSIVSHNMSRRYPHTNPQQHHNQQQQERSGSDANNYSGNRNSHRTHKVFVPKNQNPISGPNQTLSNHLRQSLSDQPNDAFTATSPAGACVAASSDRIRIGGDGELVSSSRPASVSQGVGNFVKYLPQDEAVAAGLGAEEGGLDPVESQGVVDLLNKELSRLLKLRPRDFWKEVASDASLYEFLDSFLKHRSRWYDFPHRGAKGIVAGVIVGELELSRRVFMLLYRISSNRDEGARASDVLSSKDHAALLQEKKLLDLPKLLDICAIYGQENDDLTELLVRNALKSQPWVLGNFPAVVSHFLGIVHTMHERCISSLEVLFSSGGNGDKGSSLLLTDFLEVVDFINDAIVSMDAFVTAYKPAAVYFSCPVDTSYANEDLLITLARLHDTLLPSLQRGFRLLLARENEGMRVNTTISLKMLSMRMIKFGWKLLNLCYLHDPLFEDCLSIPAVTKMFPANVEDPVIRADILIQTFKEINGVLLYTEENEKRLTFFQMLDKNYHIMSRLESLQNAGWIVIDDEQLAYLSGIMVSTQKSIVKDPPVVPIASPGDKVQLDEDAAVIESKISQIKDLFPDFGKGFLAACLEVYNQNPEEVIQRILEGTLHEDLQCLDTSSETMKLPPKSTSIPSMKDKGKGKMVESTAEYLTPLLPSNNYVPEGPQTTNSSGSSSSAFGRFVRKSNDVSDRYTLDTKDEKDEIRIASLVSQYEYEDEYDDSFDDLGLSVVESVEENETLSERLGNSSAESLSHSAPGTKWGSRRKPQYYVKDGKNYSYRVEGSVAVANADEASLISRAQGELIYGLGRGGNLPTGAHNILARYQEQEASDGTNMEGRGHASNSSGRGKKEREGRLAESSQEQYKKSDYSEHTGNSWGGGRGRGRGRLAESSQEQDKKSDISEMGGRAHTWGRGRGRGRVGGEGSTESHEEQDKRPEAEVEERGSLGNARGRGRGRAGNHNRKSRALKKHLSGVSGS